MPGDRVLTITRHSPNEEEIRSAVRVMIKNKKAVLSQGIRAMPL